MRQSKEKKFEKIYSDYKDTVFCISIMYLKDYQLAEDASQEVFIKILKKLGSLKDEKKTKAWISKITINICRDKLRHKSRREIPIEQLPEAEAESVSEIDKLTVGEAIGRLAPELREIIILYYYQSFTQTEISEMLKIPLSTTAYRLRTAKAQLKEYLKEDFDE